MKRIIFLILLCFCTPLHSDDEPQEGAVDQPAIQLEQESETTEESHPTPSLEPITQLEQATPQEAKQNLFAFFQRFIRTFLILLNNPQMNNSIKTMEQMIVNLVQTAMQVIKDSKLKPNSTPQDMGKKLLETDPDLQKALMKALQKGATEFIQTREYSEFHSPNCNCHKPKDAPDRTTQIVLGNFARIASHFINILQDPNNSENVTPNLVGMLSGMVNIGIEVIRSGKFDEEANEHTISDYVKELDYEIKEQLMATLYKTIHRT